MAMIQLYPFASAKDVFQGSSSTVSDICSGAVIWR